MHSSLLKVSADQKEGIQVDFHRDIWNNHTSTAIIRHYPKAYNEVRLVSVSNELASIKVIILVARSLYNKTWKLFKWALLLNLSYRICRDDRFEKCLADMAVNIFVLIRLYYIIRQYNVILVQAYSEFSGGMSEKVPAGKSVIEFIASILCVIQEWHRIVVI